MFRVWVCSFGEEKEQKEEEGGPWHGRAAVSSSPQPVLHRIPPSQRWGNTVLIPKQLQVGLFLPQYPDSTLSHLKLPTYFSGNPVGLFSQSVCLLIAPSWNFQTI